MVTKFGSQILATKFGFYQTDKNAIINASQTGQRPGSACMAGPNGPTDINKQ